MYNLNSIKPTKLIGARHAYCPIVSIRVDKWKAGNLLSIPGQAVHFFDSPSSTQRQSSTRLTFPSPSDCRRACLATRNWSKQPTDLRRLCIVDISVQLFLAVPTEDRLGASFATVLPQKP
jgi:hypothetical protein